MGVAGGGELAGGTALGGVTDTDGAGMTGGVDTWTLCGSGLGGSLSDTGIKLRLPETVICCVTLVDLSIWSTDF